MASSTERKLRSGDSTGQTIDPNQALKASKALLAHMSKAAEEKASKSDKKSLLDDEASLSEQPIWLTIATKRHIVDSARLKPGKVVLAHPLNTDPQINILLITADPQRAYKNLVASDEFPEEWRKRINRVIDVGKLRKKFKQYEELRKLYAEHDVVLGDSRIINRLPKVLGKTFYKSTAKRPIPVEIEARRQKVDGKRVKREKAESAINACTPTELAAEVQKAVGAALIHLTPSASTAVRIGYAGWTAQEIADNASIVARVLVDKYVPQGWKNLKSIHIKGSETAALPLWLTDQLWLDEKDIVANESEEAKALKAAEKPNIGKKRKSLDGATEETAPVTKKPKKAKADAPIESDDAKLDKEIAERKAKLKKQKAAARKAVEV